MVQGPSPDVQSQPNTTGFTWRLKRGGLSEYYALLWVASGQWSRKPTTVLSNRDGMQVVKQTCGKWRTEQMKLRSLLLARLGRPLRTLRREATSVDPELRLKLSPKKVAVKVGITSYFVIKHTVTLVKKKLPDHLATTSPTIKFLDSLSFNLATSLTYHVQLSRVPARRIHLSFLPPRAPITSPRSIVLPQGASPRSHSPSLISFFMPFVSPALMCFVPACSFYLTSGRCSHAPDGDPTEQDGVRQ
jgi:hypothetical protein